MLPGLDRAQNLFLAFFLFDRSLVLRSYAWVDNTQRDMPGRVRWGPEEEFRPFTWEVGRVVVGVICVPSAAGMLCGGGPLFRPGDDTDAPPV